MALKRSFTDDSDCDGKRLKVRKNALEPNFINYLSVPSLESISIVNITTVLCKQSVIIDAIRKHLVTYDPVGWKIRGPNHDESLNEIESTILSNLDRLPLPELLKIKASNTARPIYLQIVSWMRNDRKNVDYFDSICWSSDGTIDRIETLKRLIDKDAGQYVESNFELACEYCLEESVHRLWNDLPEDTKEHYKSMNEIYKSYDKHLIAFWTHNISSELPAALFMKKIRPYDKKRVYDLKASVWKNMFALALFTKNNLAVKYFWNKLTYVEISNNLADWAQFTLDDGNIDGLCFLLSQMNSGADQSEVLRRKPKVILKWLISDWRKLRYFMPTINLLWEHVDVELYDYLLRCAYYDINIRNREGRNFPFEELWSDTPVNLKKEYIDHVLRYDKMRLFSKLLIMEKVNTAKAMLECANLEDRKKTLFKVGEDNDFFYVIHSGKLHLFDDLCIDVLPQSDVKCIKERIAREHSSSLCSEWIKVDEWDKVNGFLNWAFDTQDQIDRFKNGTLKKTEVTYSVIYYGRNFESANKFLRWCFSAEEEIREFKIDFARSKSKIVEIGCDDWKLFEKFVDWCFHSDEEIQNFKSYISRSAQFYETMFSCIVFGGYKFDFIENLIRWCCNSPEELKEFKERVALSYKYMHMLQRFVSNYKLYDSDWNNWELIKKLLELVQPLDADVIVEMKKRIESRIDFDDFRGNFSMLKIPDTCYRVGKKHLFRLLDNDSYDISVDSDSSEDDQECEDQNSSS